MESRYLRFKYHPKQKKSRETICPCLLFLRQFHHIFFGLKSHHLLQRQNCKCQRVVCVEVGVYMYINILAYTKSLKQSLRTNTFLYICKLIGRKAGNRNKFLIFQHFKCPYISSIRIPTYP